MNKVEIYGLIQLYKAWIKLRIQVIKIIEKIENGNIETVVQISAVTEACT